jgi:DNA-binding transcriptional LysR family regulator
MNDDTVATQMASDLTPSRAPRSRRVNVEQRSFDQAILATPTPLSQRMIMLRCMAEDLHMQWAADNHDYVQAELNRVSRKDLAILCAIMNDCALPLRRPAFANWLENALSTESEIAINSLKMKKPLV